MLPGCMGALSWPYIGLPCPYRQARVHEHECDTPRTHFLLHTKIGTRQTGRTCANGSRVLNAVAGCCDGDTGKCMGNPLLRSRSGSLLT